MGGNSRRGCDSEFPKRNSGQTGYRIRYEEVIEWTIFCSVLRSSGDCELVDTKEKKDFFNS